MPCDNNIHSPSFYKKDEPIVVEEPVEELKIEEEKEKPTKKLFGRKKKKGAKNE